MNFKQIGKIVGVAVVALLIVFVFNSKSNQISPVTQNEEVSQVETVVLSIEGLYIDKQVSISTGDTVLTTLEKLNEVDTELQLSTKEYSGLGTLIEAMDGRINGTAGNYWQYQINEVTPLIGADKYELNDGDRIKWYFGPSEF